jgi:hypothetical protein
VTFGFGADRLRVPRGQTVPEVVLGGQPEPCLSGTLTSSWIPEPNEAARGAKGIVHLLAITVIDTLSGLVG